jgi:TPR repeat protein
MVPMWENEPDIDELCLHASLSTDPTRALAGLRALAGRGSVMSMVYIAYAYRTGIGTKIDLTQAEEWHRRAVTMLPLCICWR